MPIRFKNCKRCNIPFPKWKVESLGDKTPDYCLNCVHNVEKGRANRSPFREVKKPTVIVKEIDTTDWFESLGEYKMEEIKQET